MQKRQYLVICSRTPRIDIESAIPHHYSSASTMPPDASILMVDINPTKT
jgi:hypothetical protein